MANNLPNVLKVSDKLYSKAWRWAAKRFGTFNNDGQMLTDEGSLGMDCYLAGVLSTKKKRKKKKSKK